MIQDDVYFDAMDKMKKEFLKYKDLPFAVYINSSEGVFLDFNKEARTLLELQDGDKETLNIRTLYVNEKERNRLEKKYIDNKETDGWLREEMLFLKVGKEQTRRHFKYSSLPFFKNNDLNEGNWVGSLCMLLETSALERFSHFKEDIPAGIFEVSVIDGVHSLVYYDKKISKLFGLPYPIKNNIPAKDFLVNSKGVKQLIDKLLAAKDDRLENEPMRLKRPFDDEKPPMLVSMDIKGVFHYRDGERILVKAQGILNEHGIIIDFLNKAPLGLYIVMEDQDEEEIITWANDSFGRITGHDSGEKCIGKNIMDPCFHKNKAEYFSLKSALKHSFLRGESLSDHFIEFVNFSGVHKQVVLYANGLPKNEKDLSQGMLGRVGVSMDISEKIRQRLFNDMHNDFGAFLHMFLALLQDFKSTLNAILEGHNTNIVIDGETNVSEAYKLMVIDFRKLNNDLDIFINEISQKKEALGPYINHLKSKITKYINGELLTEIKYSSDYKTHAAALRRFAIALRDEFKANNDFVLKYERFWQPIKDRIIDVLRYARLITLTQIVTEIENMFSDIGIIRKAILSELVQNHEVEKIKITDLMGEISANLSEYAANENVEIRFHYYNRPSELIIEGKQRDLFVAIYNILHNAIKYSFKKPIGVPSWVDVDVVRDDMKSFITISIENRGVGIDPKERAHLFKFSYRGLHSGDRRRQGTGVGLWHSSNIIKAYNGYIDFTSDPIDSNARDYKKPFITKFKLTFPVKTK